MDRKQVVAVLFASGPITAVAIVAAAASGNRALSATAAGMFALTLIAAAVWLNGGGDARPQAHAPLDEAPPAATPGGPALAAARVNAWLMTGVFAWGGAAILGGYYLTGLFWHHAWQYGLGMWLVALGLAVYARRLASVDAVFAQPLFLKRAASLALLQGVAAAVGLAFLIGSGKLSAGKSDWLANHVFLAGGVMITVISLLAARAQLRGGS